MPLVSKPVDWEVFSIPPIQSVQYYSILKKQREFSQLIKQYDREVFRHGYLHYCSIVPKYLSSSFSDRCEMFVVFLDGISTTSFIGFRVNVNKETFIYESKSLLHFLKNSEKSFTCSMNNNCIHVHCETNAWELFYRLYDDYLRKCVLTIIGTRFYYNFVYSYCIETEKQLLKCLYKGSKIIRVAKSSIFYKIHRKRKISVSDLIHMTLNMPKRKKRILSSLDFKKSLVNSNMSYGDFYTVAGNKINLTKLMLKKFKRQELLEKSHQKSTVGRKFHKRKRDEVGAGQNLQPRTPYKNEYIKVLKSCSSKNEWEHYQTIKPFSFPNYSSLSFISTLVPSLLKAEILPCNMNLSSIKSHSIINLFSSSFKAKKMKNSTDVQMAYQLENSKLCEHLGNLIERTPSHGSKSVTTYSRCVIPNVFSPHYSVSSNNSESLQFPNNSGVTKSCDIDSNHFPTRIKVCDSFAAEDKDVCFSTAAGKVINISAAAMSKAYKFCEKGEILPDKSTSDVVKQNEPQMNVTVKHQVPENINYSDSIRKYVNKDINLPKNIPSLTLNNENMLEKHTTAHLSNTENLQEDKFDITQDVTFSTAAGKTINLSNSAIEAAQKLIYKVSDENKKLLPRKSSPGWKKHFYNNETSNNSCTSKAYDVGMMDNTFVEKFFEDVQFDETELVSSKNNVKKDNLNIVTVSKNDNKSLPTHKLRKSLGGRRSMRYCSDKL